jgi:hypothetical protein
MSRRPPDLAAVLVRRLRGRASRRARLRFLYVSLPGELPEREFFSMEEKRIDQECK